MQNSLKDKLLQEIKGAYPNMFSIQRVEDLAMREGYKTSNAERRLRELCGGESLSIRPIKSEKHYIVGYIYIEQKPPFTLNIKPSQQDALPIKLSRIYG